MFNSSKLGQKLLWSLLLFIVDRLAAWFLEISVTQLKKWFSWNLFGLDCMENEKEKDLFFTVPDESLKYELIFLKMLTDFLFGFCLNNSVSHLDMCLVPLILWLLDLSFIFSDVITSVAVNQLNIDSPSHRILKPVNYNWDDHCYGY